MVSAVGVKLPTTLELGVKVSSGNHPSKPVAGSKVGNTKGLDIPGT